MTSALTITDLSKTYPMAFARYAVRKDRWNDVAIQIYYQPGHEYNLDRMIAATKAGLDYSTTAFGAYTSCATSLIDICLAGAPSKRRNSLAKVENQDYIHYRKGRLVMCALADYIGEANLNRAIRADRDEWA